ncbi:hypothetical protein [Flavobacterium sp. J27]|uniref:hypothetical protein n=1 Tax=Flavobacterium sp. J27 TaxID=2060419 RepID=UPI00102FDAC3|nr:hypothetical protein [Flavobacterium sp. J27]
MDNSNLKPIPFTASKALIRKMYNYVADKDLVIFFKNVIKETNASNPFSKRSILCKTLTHLEWAKLVKAYGKPKGYYITPEFEETLQQLQLEKEIISTKEILHKTTKCITEIREDIIVLQKDTSLTKITIDIERQKIINRVCFKYNLQTSYIERIIGFNQNKNNETSEEI